MDFETLAKKTAAVYSENAVRLEDEERQAEKEQREAAELAEAKQKAEQAATQRQQQFNKLAAVMVHAADTGDEGKTRPINIGRSGVTLETYPDKVTASRQVFAVGQVFTNDESEEPGETTSEPAINSMNVNFWARSTKEDIEKGMLANLFGTTLEDGAVVELRGRQLGGEIFGASLVARPEDEGEAIPGKWPLELPLGTDSLTESNVGDVTFGLEQEAETIQSTSDLLLNGLFKEATDKLQDQEQNAELNALAEIHAL